MVTQTPVRHNSRRLLAAAAALLLLAVVALAFLFLRSVGGYSDWPEGSEVPQDGAGHVVEVDPDKTFYVWVYGIYDDADCSVTDTRSGEAVRLRKPSRELIRAGGAVHYFARQSGRPEGNQLEVTCAAVAGDNVVPVYVDSLDGPAFVEFLGPLWPVPIGLGGLGAALLVVAGVMRIRRRS